MLNSDSPTLGQPQDTTSQAGSAYSLVAKPACGLRLLARTCLVELERWQQLHDLDASTLPAPDESVINQVGLVALVMDEEDSYGRRELVRVIAAAYSELERWLKRVTPQARATATAPTPDPYVLRSATLALLSAGKIDGPSPVVVEHTGLSAAAA